MNRRLWPEHKAHLGVRQSEKRGRMDGWMHERKTKERKANIQTQSRCRLALTECSFILRDADANVLLRLLSLVLASFRSPLHNWLLIRTQRI
ncbi:hypothetical protein QQF64_006108 [Cirrhinus molitorella]|uniref:Uncharacterized protein n=1 Tax=Cirrhinus molitorella TaxID=172907 RepID=A0ABR3MH89_9TELE